MTLTAELSFLKGDTVPTLGKNVQERVSGVWLWSRGFNRAVHAKCDCLAEGLSVRLSMPSAYGHCILVAMTTPVGYVFFVARVARVWRFSPLRGGTLWLSGNSLGQ
jgi:hypothetical protein